jgi:hypothetical protein
VDIVLSPLAAAELCNTVERICREFSFLYSVCFECDLQHIVCRRQSHRRSEGWVCFSSLRLEGHLALAEAMA